MLSSTLTVWGICHIFQAVFGTLQDRSEILAFGMKRKGVQMINWEKILKIIKKSNLVLQGINHHGGKKNPIPCYPKYFCKNFSILGRDDVLLFPTFRLNNPVSSA